jgi:hypothetical protein
MIAQNPYRSDIHRHRFGTEWDQLKRREFITLLGPESVKRWRVFLMRAV